MNNNVLTRLHSALPTSLKKPASVKRKTQRWKKNTQSFSQQVPYGLQIGTALLQCVAASDTTLGPADRAEQAPLTSWLPVPSLTS